MAINEAELNADRLHRAWQERQIRVAILISTNEAELNSAHL